VRANRKPATLLACLLLLSLIVAQGSDRRTSLTRVRTLPLPSSAVLDQHAQPLIASSGKVGFVASITGGSLISFNLASGRILSSVAVGENIGPISMIETASSRLIAVPAANHPRNGTPATVTVIDATNAKRLLLKSLLVLPSGAQITSSTAAVLTGDGRFCLIGSSFDVPTLYSFDIETGQLNSHLALIGRPSEVALYDNDGRRLLAVASAEENTLSIIKLDEQGGLSVGASFNPSVARFDEANNPAFSADGRVIYIAGATGDRLFAIDSESGIIIDGISVASPERVTVSASADGIERIGVIRVRRTPADKPGGVTIAANLAGQLTIRSEFTPPEEIAFSSANNVEFTGDGMGAFVGSTSGMLFAFDTDSGELQSYQEIKGEVHRIALSEKTRSVAAVCSASSGDEVIILSFDVVGSDGVDPSSPSIDSLSPDTVEQGRINNLKLVVKGQNLGGGSSLVVNGVEVAADFVGRHKAGALEARLPKSLFDQASPISVQIKAANGALSPPRAINVVRPGVPYIQSITPTRVPGPSGPFTLRVTGNNFRASSTIIVAGEALNTRQVSAKVLQATIPADIAGIVRKDPLKVQVKDLAVADLVSANAKELLISGPRITELKTSAHSVVAGDHRFTLTIRGENFREGSQVAVNGSPIPANRIVSASRKAITLVVPGDLFQEAGKLRVVVRSDGDESAPRELAVHAPQITSFKSSKIFAGAADAKVDIVGRNFRHRARVYIQGSSTALEIPAAQVRFRNSNHITVKLDGDLKELLAKPDTLQFQVVNRNDADGVPSAGRSLGVVGPSVTNAVIEAAGDDAHRQIRIDGANFRRGAIIEFVKNGAVVLQQSPKKIDENTASAIVRSRRLEALGDFKVRIVNPGASPVPSNQLAPRRADDIALQHD
jgi:hypothetical protein